MKLDLHTHSAASDGLLAPAALLARALEAGVELFSITDHDTLAAYDDIGRQDFQGRTRVVSGVELSADWRGRVVHVLTHARMEIEVTAATLGGDVPDGELVPYADLPQRAVPKVTRVVIERAR